VLNTTKLRWLLLAFALGAVAFFAREPSTPVDAHALLVRADPPVNSQLRDPPRELTLYFSEPLERKFSSVRVTDQDGNRVDQTVTFDDTDKALMRVTLSDLKPGYVTVDWQTVSAVDGHHITGSYPITILNENGSVAATPPAATSSVAGDEANPARVVTKAVLLIAMSLVVGAFAFLSFVTPGTGDAEARAPFERRLLIVLAVAFSVVFVAGLAELLLQAANINAGVGQTLKTQWGERWWWRHAVLIQPALLIPIMFKFPSARRGAAMGALVGTACYLAIVSSSSHAAAGGGSFWAASSDFVHLLAASVWIGTLAVLGLYFAWARRTFTGQERYQAQATALRRFSLIAVFSVTLLLFTGVINAIIEVGSLGDLFNTGYGEILLLKLLLLIPLLAIGMRNAYLLRPQIVQEASERSTEQRREFLGELETELHKTIRWELGVAVAVLAVVAILVQLTPTRGRVDVPEQAGKYVLTADAEDIFVTLTIDPNQPGSNTFEVYLAGRTDTVENLRLEFVQPGGFASPSRLALDASNPPTFYIGQGPFLTAPGKWTITLNIRRNVGFDLRLDFQDEVKAAAAPAASDARIGGSFNSPIALTLSVTLLLGVTAAGTLILLLGSLPRRGYPDGYLAWAVEEASYRLPVTRLRPLISLGVLVAVGIGLGIIVGSHTHSRLSPSAATAGNPIPSTQDSIDKGRVLFMNNCTKCHGETGRGDGPLASSLPIPPANLYDHIPYHPDQFFFGVMTKGLSGVMPAFENVLSENDRWNILNFLRDQFGNPDPAKQ
jgi:copper transport protein